MKKWNLFITTALALTMAVGPWCLSEGRTVWGGIALEAFAAEKETIKEQVLVERDGVRITALGLDRNGFSGPELKLLIENGSGRDLKVRSCGVSVNGYMNEAKLQVSVNNGEGIYSSLVLSREDLERCSIETLAEIEVCFNAYAADDYSDLFYSEPVVMRTAAVEGFQQKYDESGVIAYDGDGVKIVLKGLDRNGPGIVVGIENTGEEKISVTSAGCYVNGVRLYLTFAREVMSGKRSIGCIVLPGYEMESKGIREIREAVVSFYYYKGNELGKTVETDPVRVPIE